jgi:hypothetical protein
MAITRSGAQHGLLIASDLMRMAAASMFAAAWPGFRHRIQPALAQRLTSQQPAHSQPASAHRTEALNRLHRVDRTARMEAAVLSEQRADESLVTSEE